MKKFNLFVSLIMVLVLMGFTNVSKAQYVYETIYSETFGITTTTTQVDAHTDYDVTTVAYTASSTVVTIRATNSSNPGDTAPQYPNASGGALLYMNNDAAYFDISGINTTGYQGLELSFGYHKTGSAATLDQFKVEYSTDGTVWTPINMTHWTRQKDTTDGVYSTFPAGSGTTGWYYITCEADSNTIPATAALQLRYTYISNGITSQVRIDDIKLTGARPIPYVAVLSPEDGAEFTPCDSIQIGIDVQNFSFYAAYPVPNGDGFLKIESDVLPFLGIPGLQSPIYCDMYMMMAMANIGKITLPEGNYNMIVTLVGLDSLPIAPLATDTINVSVVQEVVENPQFSVAGGDYTTVQNVEIATETEDAVIYYTTDGTDPDENSTVYTGAIEVNDTMTIKAIAMKECATSSDIVTAEYNIDTTTTGISTFQPTTISISPNPATSLLNISAKGFNQLEIVNFIGQVVYKSTMTDNRAQVDVSNLNAGIYFVRLTGDAVVTKKFIKK